MMGYKKSAKDIAFDKERFEFRREINDLKRELKSKEQEISKLNHSLYSKDDEIRALKEWLDRLLEYTELSETDMKRIVEKDKLGAEFAKKFSAFEKIIGNYMFY